MCSPVGRLGDSSFSRRFNWRNAPDGHMRRASTEEVQRSVSPRRKQQGKAINYVEQAGDQLNLWGRMQNEQDMADSVAV